MMEEATPSPAATNPYTTCLSPSGSPSPLLSSQQQQQQYPLHMTPRYDYSDQDLMPPASQVLPQVLPKGAGGGQDVWGEMAAHHQAVYHDYRYLRIKGQIKVVLSCFK